jgi:serine/threonine protein kinase
MSASANPPSAARPEKKEPAHAIGSVIEVTCLSTQVRRTLLLEAVLGTGGMSSVYAATEPDGARFAVKIMDRDLATDARVRARFLREKAIVDRVDHPARVPIFVAGLTEGGEPALVMELVEGESVEVVRRRLGGRLPLAPSLRVVDEVLELLGACHAVGVLHRDIKTTNILFGEPRKGERGRQVRVVDFGIAHCAALDDGAVADMTLGTPSFMAPEQAAGLSSDVDARADVFSAGAVLFTLLTGKRLHRGRTHDESLFLAATQAAPKLLETDDAFSDELAEVVDRALAFRREDRFAGAGHMLEAVRAIRHRAEGRLTLLGIPAATPAEEEPTPSFASGSVPVRAPDAKGTFDATPLPNLLTHILSRGLDGTLVVTSDQRREAVEFSKGAPVRRGPQVEADPLVGALFRITRLPATASYRFYIGHAEPGERDLSAQRIEPLDAILTSTRRLREDSTFVQKMKETLSRLGKRPIALHPQATPDRFGLSALERRVLDTALELDFSYGELLDAEIAPREVIDPLIYALGITRHLDVGIPTAWPAGVSK